MPPETEQETRERIARETGLPMEWLSVIPIEILQSIHFSQMRSPRVPDIIAIEEMPDGADTRLGNPLTNVAQCINEFYRILSQDSGKAEGERASWLRDLMSCISGAGAGLQELLTAVHAIDSLTVNIVPVDAGENSISYATVPGPLLGDPDIHTRVLESILREVSGEVDLVLVAVPRGARIARPLAEALRSMSYPSPEAAPRAGDSDEPAHYGTRRPIRDTPQA